MTNLERGPSSEQSPSMRVEPLLNKSPDPHSIVERLRADSRPEQIENFQLLPSIASLMQEAATIISDLQAIVDAKEVAAKAYYDNYRSEEARAIAAESSLSRIQSETVEACAKIAEEHTWTLPLYAPEENINVAVGEAANIVIGQVASAIRSSLTDVGSGAEEGATG